MDLCYACKTTSFNDFFTENKRKYMILLSVALQKKFSYFLEGTVMFKISNKLYRRALLRNFSTIDVLESRNLIFQTNNRIALKEHLGEAKSIYTGFDPTAKSLHVGNLLTIISLLHFQIGGHQAIALIGGATGSIGDPSGKSTEREVLDPKTLDNNINSIGNQLDLLFTNAKHYANRKGIEIDKPVKILNNRDWFKDMLLLDFIGNIGRHARVNSMMAKDSVKSRMDNDGISYAEFTYQLFQAYDFYHLFRNNNVSLQLGGSDQWGNITAGLDLIRRKTDRSEDSEKHCFAVTIPLVTTSSGEKFGKSEGNAIWLDKTLLSTYNFYQYFRRTPDSEVEKLLTYFTLLTPKEIATIMDHHKVDSTDQMAQKVLASEVTELVHGSINFLM
jgi:tyrosyl-tRNA synthetase